MTVVAPTPTGLLVVDDNEAFRRALRRVIEATGYTVLGEAETGEEAVEMMRRLSPQAVLMDVHLPGIGGIEAARQIAEFQPKATVLLMTLSASNAVRMEIAASGLECLLKEVIRPNTLRAAIATAEAQVHERDGTLQ